MTTKTTVAFPIYGNITIDYSLAGTSRHLDFTSARSADFDVFNWVNGETYLGGPGIDPEWSISFTFPKATGHYEIAHDGYTGGSLRNIKTGLVLPFTTGTIEVTQYVADTTVRGRLTNIGSSSDSTFLISSGVFSFPVASK